MIRPLCVLVLVLAAAPGCEKKTVGPGDGVTQLPSRAAAVGEFPDNPMLAFAPADTPYALASFKPVPPELFRRFIAMGGPLWRKALAKAGTDTDNASEQRVIKDVIEVLDHLDIKTLEDHGFSGKARAVFYGLGAWPVMRFELLDGKKVFDLVSHAAERWQAPLPPPIERAGGHYWLIDTPRVSVLAAILPKEIVVSVAPRATLDANLPALLGEQKPASSLTTAQFRAIAERDGFTGQGVGFADLARIGALVANLSTAPDCGGAVAQIATHVPRIAFGYDDFADHHMAFGMVVELAPDVLAEARGLVGKLAGLDKLLAHKPAMALATSLDVERGRTTLARVAGALAELGQRCQVQPLVENAGKIASSSARPLPPFLAGLHGGYVVLNNIKMKPQGTPDLEGYASLQLDHAGDLLKLASTQVPNLDVPADGKAHALPSLIPFAGHAAASERAIGVAVGPDSASAAVEALSGNPAPAPLLVLAYDYAKLGELVLMANHDQDAQALRDVVKMFGLAVMQVIVDNRGLVWWTSIELN